MVQSSSWEANWFAALQEIPRISRNPKVHYRTHKRPPPVSILGQPNPVHIPTSHLQEIRPSIIHPSTPRSPQWSPSLRFPHQDLYTPLSSFAGKCDTNQRKQKTGAQKKGKLEEVGSIKEQCKSYEMERQRERKREPGAHNVLYCMETLIINTVINIHNSTRKYAHYVAGYTVRSVL